MNTLWGGRRQGRTDAPRSISGRGAARIGLRAGVLGCLMAFGLTQVGNLFISGGLRLDFGPRLIAMGLALSVVMGTLGGLYPAWKASRLVPMDAIRLGSH